MKFTLFDAIYDDQGDPKARAFFQRIQKQLENIVNPDAWEQFKEIFLRNPYSETCLVEGGVLQSLCESCDGPCDRCFVKDEKKGVTNMTIQEQIDDAFGEKEKLESEDDSGFEMVQRITKDGKLEQTEASKRDEKSYWQEKKGKKETIEESDDLSDDEKILAAFK